MNAKPIFYWGWAALTVFVNGAISGMGGGMLAGAGTGAGAASPLGDGLTQQHKVMAALLAGLLAAAGNGFKRFIVWHDAHPCPNPFPSPSEPQPDPTKIV